MNQSRRHGLPCHNTLLAPLQPRPAYAVVGFFRLATVMRNVLGARRGVTHHSLSKMDLAPPASAVRGNFRISPDG